MDMEQQPGTIKEIEKFLDDVVEQIQYKPVRIEIKEELAAHIEDRKAEYINKGMDNYSAQHKAIVNMGNAVELGVHLNKIRKVQKNPLLVILITILMCVGIFGSVQVRMFPNHNSSVADISYFFYGLGIFFIVYYCGYENIVKNNRIYLTVVVGMLLLFLIFFMIQRISIIHLIRMNKPNIYYAWELLIIPIIMIMAYFYRSKKNKSIKLTTVIVAAVIFFNSLHFMDDYFLTANLIILITISSTLLYMVATGMLEGKIIRLLFSWFIGSGIMLAVYLLTFTGSWKYEFQQCFYPEKVAQNYFDDSYNSILIKNLLGKAKLVGPINISQDELKSYFTSEWYFENMDDFRYKYKMQFVNNGDVTSLEDILPEHYQTNYRIAYSIIKYGWLPSIALLLIMAVVYVILIRMVGKIRNKIGKVISFSCVLTLVLQLLLYVFGNFGFQFGRFCTFPFVSEGHFSIITNAILIGLACSAYRYDKVYKDGMSKSFYDNSYIT